MATKYAEGTTIPVENSRAELERTIHKHEADEIYFRSGRDGQAGVVFRKDGVYVRIIVAVPPLSEFALDSAGRKRSLEQQRKAHEAEERRLWRVLVLLVKAKFESVSLGLQSFRAEFLANIVLPDNSTVGDFMEPQIEDIYRTGSMPAPFQNLLGAPKE